MGRYFVFSTISQLETVMEESPKEMDAETQVSGSPFAFGELIELRLSSSTIANVHPVFNI